MRVWELGSLGVGTDWKQIASLRSQRATSNEKQTTPITYQFKPLTDFICLIT